MLWVDKYKPKLEDIPQDTNKLKDYVNGYSKQKKKALFIHGPAGTGKTSAVHALAREQNFELIEVNASDFRNANEINSRIGNALKQQSLFATSKLILIDELDGISGSKDRGGVGAISSLLKDSKFPVILMANDAWQQKLNTLRTKSLMLEYGSLGMTDMVPVLTRILEQEKIPVDEVVLKTLARRSGGDIRGAIIDLQVLAQANALTIEGLETLNEREKSESIMQALVKILKSTDPKIALGSLDMVGENFDECFLWIDENMPKEYKTPQDLARAYDVLSKADVYRGRIRRRQHWRFLVYVNVLLTAGIATAKDKKSGSFVSYTRTKRLLKIWMANRKYAKRKAIAQKLGTATHCSTKKALQESLPYIQHLYQHKHSSVAAITEELKLDEEEVEWLGK